MEALKIKNRTMETVKNNDRKELADAFNSVIEEVKEKVKNSYYENNIGVHKKMYKIKNEENLQNIILDSDVDNKKIKRFRRYLNSYIKKRSINSLNRLFFVVYKTIMGISDYPRVISIKHDDIQKKRKKWLELKELADKALIDYKEEKSDFYKKNDEYYKI